MYEPGQETNTLTVIEISKPVVEGKDLVYSYKLIEGKVPTTGGAACHPSALIFAANADQQ